MTQQLSDSYLTPCGFYFPIAYGEYNIQSTAHVGWA